MGLLDKLFDKKDCAICGGEIGLLGNRKLADGNLCKNCAGKLSPFFTERRQSTVAEIRQHLAYRERNQQLLLGVTPTRVFGFGYKKVYVDENQGLFFISGDRNYLPHNPDVLSVTQVIGFRPSIHEDRTELYHHDKEGRQVPYHPPRYQVEYRFDVEIEVNVPFIGVIRLEFSDDRPDSPRSSLYAELESELMALQAALTPANYATLAPSASMDARPAAYAPAIEPQPAPAASAPASLSGWTCACGQVNQGKFCTNCGAKKPAVYRCDKCGWMPEDPNKLPKFCPNCGDPFNEADVE